MDGDVSIVTRRCPSGVDSWLWVPFSRPRGGWERRPAEAGGAIEGAQGFVCRQEGADAGPPHRGGGRAEPTLFPPLGVAALQCVSVVTCGSRSGTDPGSPRGLGAMRRPPAPVSPADTVIRVRIAGGSLGLPVSPVVQSAAAADPGRNRDRDSFPPFPHTNCRLPVTVCGLPRVARALRCSGSESAKDSDVALLRAARQRAH